MGGREKRQGARGGTNRVLKRLKFYTKEKKKNFCTGKTHEKRKTTRLKKRKEGKKGGRVGWGKNCILIRQRRGINSEGKGGGRAPRVNLGKGEEDD